MNFIKSKKWNSYKPWVWVRLTGLIPGSMVIGVVILARLAGLLQGLEWSALDHGLRLRPKESIDERIVIVGITEADIQNLGTYPISDQDLATLLRKIQSYKPRAIGLDIFRDLAVNPGHAQLKLVLESSPNLVGIENIQANSTSGTKPPPSLPVEQVGFVDSIVDTDGALRRSLLGFREQREENYHFSFAIRLAQLYLAEQGIDLENGFNDPKAMRFETAELTRFQDNTGGYIRADAGGNQILLNFRSGPTPFRIVSMADIIAGNIDSNTMRDRIVLIGITAESHQDLHNVPAIATPNQPLTYGVIFQAHAISQILSLVLDRRPLLTAWPDIWDYFWIIAWGGIGLIIGQLSRTIKHNYLLTISALVCLIGLVYAGLIGGLWIPIIPAIFVLLGANTVIYIFSVHNRNIETRLHEHRQIIERMYNAIHNGPLQTLAAILRYADESDSKKTQSYSQLQQLNLELRDIYEKIRRETLEQSNEFIVLGDHTYDLSLPLHRVLYEVYTYTIQRDFPGFKEINLNVVDFEPLDTKRLSIENKRSLCRFLEEALCNIGKHASGPTRLKILCRQEKHHNVLRIEDNGEVTENHLQGYQLGHRGTRQAINLSRELRGHFERRPGEISGTICELIWPKRKVLLSNLSLLLNNE